MGMARAMSDGVRHYLILDLPESRHHRKVVLKRRQWWGWGTVESWLYQPSVAGEKRQRVGCAVNLLTKLRLADEGGNIILDTRNSTSGGALTIIPEKHS